MTLGQQITALRKKKGLSEADLGKAEGTSGDIIGRYERDEVKPSIEVTVKVADTPAAEVVSKNRGCSRSVHRLPDW